MKTTTKLSNTFLERKMNERIKELRGKVKMDLTKFHSDPEFFKNHVEPLAKIFDNGDNAVLNEYMTKFAELIVKECLVNCQSEMDKREIRKHFGVEE